MPAGVKWDASKLISKKCLDTLRCDNCHNFLSCGPITTDTKRIHCGRCPRSVHMLIGYDKAARHFIFPCRYWCERCDFKHFFNKIAQHEEDCSYRSGCSRCCSHPFNVCCRSRRKWMSNSTVPTTFAKISPEVMADLGRCLSCNGVISSSPIYSCEGQLLCFRCSYTKPPPKYIRELPLETLLSSFQFPCNNQEWGCPEYIRFGRDMDHHEQTCPYKPSSRTSKHTKDPDGKLRGIIQSHRGPTYGTISPHHHIFVQESETIIRQNDGLVVSTKKEMTREQEQFNNEMKHKQQQRILRSESQLSRSAVQRVPSHLRNVPMAHQSFRQNHHQQEQPRQQRHHQQRQSEQIEQQNHQQEVFTISKDVGRRNSGTSSNAGSFYSDMNEAREAYSEEEHSARVMMSKLENPGSKPKARYYDTNYNKVLLEFKYKKRAELELEKE